MAPQLCGWCKEREAVTYLGRTIRLPKGRAITVEVVPEMNLCAVCLARWLRSAARVLERGKYGLLAEKDG